MIPLESGPQCLRCYRLRQILLTRVGHLRRPSLTALPTLIATVAYHADCNGAEKANTKSCEKKAKFYVFNQF